MEHTLIIKAQARLKMKCDRNIIWRFFTRLSIHLSGCKQCDEVIEGHINSLNLQKHLFNNHRDHFNQYLETLGIPLIETNWFDSYAMRYVKEESMKEETIKEEIIEDEITIEEERPLSPNEQQELTLEAGGSETSTAKIKNAFAQNYDLMDFVISDNQPFSILDNECFKKFIMNLMPKHVISLPPEVVLRREMQLAYAMCYEVMKETARGLIKQARKEEVTPCASLSIETWISKSIRRYVSITAHFVNYETMKHKAILLNTSELIGDKNNCNKPLIIVNEKVVKEWGLQNQVKSVVVSNLIRSVECNKITNEVPTINNFNSCFATDFHNLINESLSFCKSTIRKVKQVVEFYLDHSISYDALMKSTKKEPGDFEIRSCNPDKWISVYEMLKQFLESEEYLKTCKLQKSLTLTMEEWEIVRELCIVVQPLYEIAMKLIAEGYMRAHMAIVLVTGLKTMFAKMKERKWCDKIQSTINFLQEKIAVNYAGIEHNKMFSTCTLLDPRFKDFAFTEREAAEEAKIRLAEFAKEQSESAALEKNEPEPEEKIVTGGAFSVWNHIEENAAKRFKPSVEMDDYGREPLLSRDGCPLEWWRAHRDRYPKLYKIYMSTCHEVVSCSPCRLIFSEDGAHNVGKLALLPESEYKHRMFLARNEFAGDHNT